MYILYRSRVQKNTGERPSKRTRRRVAGAEKFPDEKRSRACTHNALRVSRV